MKANRGLGRGLDALMPELPFAHCVPFSGAAPAAGPARTGVLLRGAAHEAPPPALLARIEHLLHLDGPGTLRYADRRRAQHRAARLQRQADGRTTLDALLLAGNGSAGGWLRTLLQEELPVQTYGRLLLLPTQQPPVAVANPRM